MELCLNLNDNQEAVKTPAQIRGEAIRRAREARGWSQDRLAEAIGISQPAIKKVEDGVTVRSRFIADIEAALGLTGKQPATPQPGAQAPIGSTLPIFGLEEAESGFLMLSKDFIDTAPMPERLANVPDAYGLYMAGSSMVPRYRAGDTLLIHPHLPPRSDDGIILYSVDKVTACVFEFVRSDSKTWTVRRYHPKQEEIVLSRAEWPKCHVVFGSYSRR